MKKFTNKDSILIYSQTFDENGVHASELVRRELNLSDKEHIKVLHERLDSFIRHYRYGFRANTWMLRFESQQPELLLPFDK